MTDTERLNKLESFMRKSPKRPYEMVVEIGPDSLDEYFKQLEIFLDERKKEKNTEQLLQPDNSKKTECN